MSLLRQAQRFLGLCAGRQDRINFGEFYVRRNDKLYHADCDPGRKHLCWCVTKGYLNADYDPGAQHIECFQRLGAMAGLVRAFQGAYMPDRERAFLERWEKESARDRP